MSAFLLNVPVSTGRVLRLSRVEASTLEGFRRSPYAEPMKEIMAKMLDEARFAYETELSSEENRMLVAAAKRLIAATFESKLELE